MRFPKVIIRPLSLPMDFYRGKYYNKTFLKALTGLLAESTMQDRSTILKALQKSVEDQIMKELEKIPAATRPRMTLGRTRNLRRKNDKMTWYSRIS